MREQALTGPTGPRHTHCRLFVESNFPNCSWVDDVANLQLGMHLIGGLTHP